jgi:MFS family permease
MRKPSGGKLLAALWGVVGLNFGFTAYAPAVINAAMAHLLGFDRQTLGELFGLYMIMSGVPGPLVGLCIDRFGPRATLLGGSGVILAGAILLATWVTSAEGALLCFGVLLGVGNVSGALLPAQTLVASRLGGHRASALAVLYSGGACGGFVAAPLAGYLIRDTGSWRAGWWLIAAASTLAACIGMFLVQDEASVRPRAPAADDSAATGWTVRQALRHRTFWLILAAFMGASGGNTLFLAQGVAHLQDLGHSAAFAAGSVGTLTASGLVGKAILAALGGRADLKTLLAGFLAAFGTGLCLLVTAAAAWQAVCAVVLLGVGFGGGFVCLMALVRHHYGGPAFAVLAGTMMAIPTAFSAVIASLAGRSFDAGYGYASAFYGLGAWCLGGALVLATVRPPVRPGRPA